MPRVSNVVKQQRIGERLSRAMAKAHMDRRELAALTGYSEAQGRLSWRPLRGAVALRSPMRSRAGAAPTPPVRTYDYGDRAVIVESWHRLCRHTQGRRFEGSAPKPARPSQHLRQDERP